MNRNFCLAALIAAVMITPEAAAGTREDWTLSGDLRAAYAASWRDRRDGTQRHSDGWGSRFRLRLRREIDANWRFQARFATTFEDRGNDPAFRLSTARAGKTAVEPGLATLDELFVAWTSDDGRNEFRVGRMQSTLKLPLITNKSLDRNQASNINIGWTDGVYYGRRLGEDWQVTVTAQYNGPDGNGNVTRGPLEFDDSDSRISTFATLESDTGIGPVFLRALSLTWYPDALAVDGPASARREDYVAATAKLAAGWDVGEQTRLVLAGAAARAFNRPASVAVGLPDGGDADGFGWHLGADLVGILPNHTAGVIFGQADAGWLLSNDYRENDSLAEFRWQWYASDSLRVEFRARWRREQERLDGAPTRRRDRDMRLRATWKF